MAKMAEVDEKLKMAKKKPKMAEKSKGTEK